MTTVFGPFFDDLPAREPRPSGLARYAKVVRPVIKHYIAGARRLEELSESFPALLFALATNYGSRERRLACEQLILQGVALKTAAEAIGLPWWLRRLPPEYFTNTLPQLPDSPEFACRIGNSLAPAGIDGNSWLQRIAVGYAAAGEDYALWIARQRRLPLMSVDDNSELLLAAWAWHSARPDTPGYKLLRAPWSEAISLRRAVTEARVWLRRLDLAAVLGTGIEDPWLASGSANGYEFVPLLKLDDFMAEAQAMGNCLDQYANEMRFGLTRVFSIRRGGRPVADVELGMHKDDRTMPTVEQLRGPRNRRVGPEIWQAVFAWLATQDYRPLQRPDATDQARRRQLVRALWRPYQAAMQGTMIEPMLPGLMFSLEGPESSSDRLGSVPMHVRTTLLSSSFDIDD